MESPESEAAGPALQPVSRAFLWLVAVVAWLVPGAGHLLLGRPRRAVAFFVIVLGTLSVGVVLDGELYHSFEHPIAMLASLASAGVGITYFLLLHVVGYVGSYQSAGYEYGKAFILTAGLMNVLLILDVLDIGRGEKP
jgi:hypothetical protein